MKKIFVILFVFVTLMNMSLQSENYKFVTVSQQRGAACVDGSPPGLYIHEGKGQNKNNFIIFFNGGGYCSGANLQQTLQDCYKRSFGKYGSTKNVQPFNGDNRGVLSQDPIQNPIFYDWTKIFAIYCDGTEYLGSRPSPIPYKDRILYFRGLNNTLQQIRYLDENYDIYNGGKIVITGQSAGGIATYAWSNHILKNTKKAKVYAMPDSGLFLTDYITPILNINIIREYSRSMVEIAMSQTKYPIQQCLNQFDGDFVQCFNALNLIKYNKVPMLIIQSTYDSWSELYMLGVTCLTNKSPPFSMQTCNQTATQAMNDYSRLLREAMKKMINIKPQTGVWSPACLQHGFVSKNSLNNPNYKVPSTIGLTLNDAIRLFLQNPQRPPVYLDEVNWPNNQGCNGLSSYENLRKQIFQ